jgi:DNA-directed RNA polymerase specialized sigma24 family protein
MNARSYDTLFAGFKTTRWELILQTRANAEDRRRALEELSVIYWPSMYAFIRMKEFGRADAEDLTQEFLALLFEGSMLEEVAPDKGRFRSYLAACCTHFLSNKRDAAKAIKRGGRAFFLSLDFDAAEIGYQSALVDAETPEKVFQRKWAADLLAGTMARLEHDYVEDGKEKLYRTIQPVLLGDANLPAYRDLAVQLETTEANIQVLIHRMRRKFGDLLRDEVKATLIDASEVEDELRFLIKVLS